MTRPKRSRIQLPPAEYKRLCFEVFRRDGWRCKCCRSRESLHCHHIVFRAQGGDDASWNLLTLCSKCHDALHLHKTLVIVAKSGKLEDDVNADEGVRVFCLNGWKPGGAKYQRLR